jgi:23S rRNA (adenine2503-C2)-methyltransferase
MDGDGLALSKRRITLSTSGVVPMMARAGEEIGVNLAVSLHAVSKDIRDEIVPINRKYGIEELLSACAAYPGANERPAHHLRICDAEGQERQRRRRARTGAADQAIQAARQGQPDPVQSLARRALRMLRARNGSAASPTSSSRPGISAPVRTPRGRDIDAACGQLKTQAQKLSRAELDRLSSPLSGGWQGEYCW